MSSNPITSSQVKAERTTGLFLHQLYELLFKNQRAEFVIYGVSLAVAMAFALIGTFVLGWPQQTVLYQGSFLALIVFSSLVIGYTYGATRTKKQTQAPGVSDPLPTTKNVSNVATAEASQPANKRVEDIPGPSEAAIEQFSRGIAQAMEKLTAGMAEQQKAYLSGVIEVIEKQNAKYAETIQRLFEQKSTKSEFTGVRLGPMVRVHPQQDKDIRDIHGFTVSAPQASRSLQDILRDLGKTSSKSFGRFTHEPKKLFKRDRERLRAKFYEGETAFIRCIFDKDGHIIPLSDEVYVFNPPDSELSLSGDKESKESESTTTER